MKVRQFIAILVANGFTEIRVTDTHRQYEGFVGGTRRLVTVRYNHLGDDIMKINFGSMVRQSGLPKKLFR